MNEIPDFIHTIPAPEIATKLAVALAAGLLVGLEREWAQKEVGVRTFSIAALLGAIASIISPGMIIAALVGVFIMVIFLNTQSLLKDRSLELTTSVSLISVLMLGAMAGLGHFFTTATAAILMTMLLAFKVELGKFADALKADEIRGAVLLGLLSFLIYPLLPNHFIDKWNLVNPQQAWITVMVIAGIGFVNYVLLRLYSTKGLYYAAVLGGLVNSTAAVAELSSAFAGKANMAARAISVLLLTNFSMFLRNIVILAIFASLAVPTAAGPLALMSGMSLLFAWLVGDRSNTRGEQLQLGSPVSMPRVLKFGVIFLAIAVVGTLAQRQFGPRGFLIVSILGGAISSASTTASAASLAASGQIPPEVAGIATVLTSISSTLVNLPLVYQQTKQTALTIKLAGLSAIIVIAGLAALLLRSWLLMQWPFA